MPLRHCNLRGWLGRVPTGFQRLWPPHCQTTNGFGTHPSCHGHILLECLPFCRGSQCLPLDLIAIWAMFCLFWGDSWGCWGLRCLPPSPTHPPLIPTNTPPIPHPSPPIPRQCPTHPHQFPTNPPSIPTNPPPTPAPNPSTTLGASNPVFDHVWLE